MSVLFDMAYGAAAVALGPYLACRMWRTGKWRTDWPGRFGHVPRDLWRDSAGQEKAKPTILLHAVSVGEVNAAGVLVQHLRAQTGDRYRIVVSAMTDTGIERARKLLESEAQVVRFPFDFESCVQRFLDRVRPDVVGLVELEVWPNLVEMCRRRRIPVCVVNGRLSARSFRGYRLARPVLRSTFGALAAAGVQTREYADRFAALGTPQERVVVTDSLKWDGARVQAPGDVPGMGALANALGLDRARPIITAGSTGPGEESMLLGHLSALPPGAQLILVPRKPERFEEVAQRAPEAVRRSRHPDGAAREPDGARVFLLDTMGELNKAYALADVALVGRSFLGMFGSNPLEPIALGRPTIIGPHVSDFSDMVEALRNADGIVVSKDPMADVVTLLAKPEDAARLADNGRRVILARQGATERCADILLRHLHVERGASGSVYVDAPRSTLYAPRLSSTSAHRA